MSEPLALTHYNIVYSCLQQNGFYKLSLLVITDCAYTMLVFRNETLFYHDAFSHFLILGVSEELFRSKTLLYNRSILVENISDVILQGYHEGDQFGYAMTLVDLNKDGVKDLTVSAPTEGSDHLIYTVSEISIYYG